MKISKINRSDLKKHYQSERQLKDITASQINKPLTETDLFPCVKLLYQVYINNVKTASNQS